MMKVKVQTVDLKGGSRDGETLVVYSYTPLVYLEMQLPRDEDLKLRKTDSIAWKRPEEVYERQPDDSFRYRNTVRYKPEEG